MKALRALLLLLVLLLAVPAGAVQEDLRITATAATTDQVSGTITRPPDADGVIVLVNVTAGAVLLLDVNMEFFSISKNAWQVWTTDCPAAGSITGVGLFACVFHPEGVTTHYGINVGSQKVMVPSEFRVLVDHGNATAATYTVRTQWIKRK